MNVLAPVPSDPASDDDEAFLALAAKLAWREEEDGEADPPDPSRRALARPPQDEGAEGGQQQLTPHGEEPRDSAASRTTNHLPADYKSFIEGKIKLAEARGFEVDPAEVNPALKPHVRAVVPWALRGGRRAIFASFGLQKTTIQLELMRLVLANGRGRGGPVLIVLPLGARQEFVRDAESYFTGEHAVTLNFCRTDAEVVSDAINLTNYESVRDGKIAPARFKAVSLDEADILRGFGGTKTFREFMRVCEGVPYRFVATATPTPNDHIEILSYAAFLDIMDVGQAKTRFFKRNSEKADELVIHPHKEREFWLWVASWALFIQRPSDLGFSDDGYVLPELDVRWHEVPSDHRGAGTERDGQGKMFRNAAAGLSEAAREKRDSLAARIAKLLELRAEDLSAHRIVWHDLEAERRAIEQACPGLVSVFGSQDHAARDKAVRDFADGKLAELGAKPVMLGAGANFQRHCAWAICLGIGFKFKDFFQGIHRLQRYGQTRRVRLDLIYTEAERDIRAALERKWKQHVELMARMSALIREGGRARSALSDALKRAIGVERAEVTGERFRLINNDCVDEVAAMAENSVDLIVTSIPFGQQYEYSPNYKDFGHTDDDEHFFSQMDYLTPQLLRVLKPGRDCAIHCKDRVVPGGMTGLGFQTISPFGMKTVFHYIRHGFAYLGTKVIVTDVVRENNQTYRLGWTEQCKDGTRMGFGLFEYLHYFRKAPTDRSDGYADVPVVKEMPFGTDGQGIVGPWDPGKKQRPIAGMGYSRGRWQFDAHGFARSSGNRLMSSEELLCLAPDQIFKWFRARSLSTVYDFEADVALAEMLDEHGRLPPIFMLLQPQSWHPDVWTDITRMRTVNQLLAAQGREMHLCPLQFDTVDRAIAQLSMPGEVVLDPFAGVMTVPYRAILAGRRGIGIELSRDYFRDGVGICRAAEAKISVPALFDLEACGPVVAETEEAAE